MVTSEHPSAILDPLKRISPSRFHSLQECALKEIWASARRPPLLPGAPQARLGTVVHKLVEYAGKSIKAGEGTPVRELLTSQWDVQLSRIEREMQESPLERHLVPLRNSIADFEVRRIRALQFAQLVAEDSVSRGEHPEDPPSERFERWLQSPSGLIGGSIDEISKTNAGAVIKDFKSGLVTEQEPVGGGMRVKREYELQLKLYAALFYMNLREWPVRLELVPLNGGVVPVPFLPDECLNLAQIAEEKLKVVNEAVKRVNDGAAKIEALAAPAPERCRFCPYRPACLAYSQAKQRADGGDWPRDLWGTVIKVHQLANGKAGLLLDVQGKQVMIRGLSRDHLRHPELESLKEGSGVAVYNASGAHGGTSYSECASTSIYKQPRPEERRFI